MTNSKIADFRIIRGDLDDLLPMIDKTISEGFNDITTLGCKPETKIGERGIKIETFDCAVLLSKRE